jgi:arginyl-tRNA synthetase
MVNFMDNGMPIRMSKRAGTFVTFKEVIERVGVEATRFMMVSRHQDSPIDFDFAAVVAQTKDNPIFYIHYAHARIHSVMRHMKSIHPDFNVHKLKAESCHTLKDEAELSMIKILATWPRTIQMAVDFREPHRITNALYEIAANFHSLWNKGNENAQLRFIDPKNSNSTQARIALIWMVATVLKTGFAILGIKAVEEMRA